MSCDDDAPSHVPVDEASADAVLEPTPLRVYFGTCGWTEPGLISCKRFYPSGIRDPIDRLRFYARKLPSVEIDTTNYAFASEANLVQWCNATPSAFVFHMKVFSFFCTRAVDPSTLPRDFRTVWLTPSQTQERLLRATDMPPGLIDALWARQLRAAQLLHDSGKLGCLVMQFQANFLPSTTNAAYIAECSRRIGSVFRVAVEFRSRSWYADAEARFDAAAVVAQKAAPHPVAASSQQRPLRTQRAETLALLRQLGFVNIIADDLASEFSPRDVLGQPTRPDGRLLVADAVSSSSAVYIRLHRRQGTQRLLPQALVAEWVARLQRIASLRAGCDAAGEWMASTASCTSTFGAVAESNSALTSQGGWQVNGSVYFLVSTAHDDQSIINIRTLERALLDASHQKSARHGDNATSQRGSFSMAAPVSISTFRCVLPIEWRMVMREQEAKTGIASFYSVKSPDAKRSRVGVNDGSSQSPVRRGLSGPDELLESRASPGIVGGAVVGAASVIPQLQSPRHAVDDESRDGDADVVVILDDDDSDVRGHPTAVMASGAEGLTPSGTPLAEGDAQSAPKDASRSIASILTGEVRSPAHRTTSNTGSSSRPSSAAKQTSLRTFFGPT